MTEEQAVEGIEWATNEITALRAKIASFEAAQSASNSPTTNGEVSEPPLKSEDTYDAGGGHAPASGPRDGSEILVPAMEAARIPAAPNDVERRLLSVAKTLETAGSQAFAIDFAQLAHDIRAALNHTTKDDEWQDIASAPKDGTAIQAEIPGNGADNVIAWQPEAFMSSCEESCGGWAFVTEQEPPDCWTDGVCWDSNEDGVSSVQPTRWKRLPPESKP